MHLYFLAFLFLAVTANPGDSVLPQECSPITYPGLPTFTACVEVVEAQSCGLTIELEVDGQVILNKDLDHLAYPRVCENFREPTTGIVCQACAEMKLEGSDYCINVQPQCPGITLPSKDIGCFPSSRLSTIKNCTKPQTTKPVDPAHFDRCMENIPGVTEPVCAKVTFDVPKCSVNVTVYSGPISYDINSFPLTVLRGRLQERNCFSQSGCSVCLNWNNLTLTEHEASGCGRFEIDCFGAVEHTQELGCFEENDLTPACFGGCKNLCSGRGTCSAARVCECIDGWNGDDCSIPPVSTVCTKDCGKHGACTKNNTCVCQKGYSGDRCEVNDKDKKANDSGSNSSGSRSVLLGVGIVTAILIAGGVAFAAVYLYHKRKTAAPTYGRLEMIDDNNIDTWEENK